MLSLYTYGQNCGLSRAPASWICCAEWVLSEWLWRNRWEPPWKGQDKERPLKETQAQSNWSPLLYNPMYFWAKLYTRSMERREINREMGSKRLRRHTDRMLSRECRSSYDGQEKELFISPLYPLHVKMASRGTKDCTWVIAGPVVEGLRGRTGAWFRFRALYYITSRFYLFDRHFILLIVHVVWPYV